MNILYIVNNMCYKNGGVCTHIIDLAKQVKNKDHQVFLICNGSDYDSVLSKIGIKVIRNIDVNNVKFNPISFLTSKKKIYELCYEYKIDIIHLHTQSAIPFASYINRKLGIPYLWTNHVDDIPYATLMKLFFMLYRFPVISVSSSLKEDLIKRFSVDSELITVIPNGIQLSSYTPLSTGERRVLEKKFNISKNEYNICILSRVTYNKGHDVLVRAVKKAQQHINKTINIIIAGSIIDNEWYRGEVEEYIKKENLKATYIGFQSPREVLGISDLFVLPSRKEGFGIVCIEALAMKCPVIRSNSPGWKEMKDFCEIVRIDDVEQLAQTIVNVFEKPKDTEHRTSLGFESVYSVFNNEVMADSTMRVYDKILNGKL